MPFKQTEKQLENAILDYLSLIGCFVWKNQTVGIYDHKKGSFRQPNSIHHKKGIPDIIGFYQNKVFFIEVKRPVKKPRPLDRLIKLLSDDQLIFYNECKRRGIKILIADNLKSVEYFIKRF